MFQEIAVLSEPDQISGLADPSSLLGHLCHNSSLDTCLRLLNLPRGWRIIQTNRNLIIRFLNLLCKNQLPLHIALQLDLDRVLNLRQLYMSEDVLAWEGCYCVAAGLGGDQLDVEAAGELELQEEQKQESWGQPVWVILHLYYSGDCVDISGDKFITLMSAEKININLNLKGTHLEQTFHQLVKQKSSEITQKIDKTLQKQKHILQIQQQLQQRLRQKNEQILNKLNKSAEAKKKSIEKVREKVHVKIKFQMEKYKGFQKRERVEANRSWRESIKLAQWTNNRNEKMGKSHVGSDSKRERLQEVEEERDQVGDLGEIKQTEHLPFITSVKNVQSPEKRPRKLSGNFLAYSRSKSEQRMETEEANKSISYVEKIKEEYKKKEEEGISKFNWKLRRLEEARMKKQKMQKEKQKKIHEELQFKKQKQLQTKRSQKNVKKDHQRTKTEGNSELLHYSKSSKREMFKRWQEQNKFRQLQLFQMRLRKGEDYLTGMFDKTMKNKMNRQLQMSSIEKKLYMERKSLHELSRSMEKSSP